MRLFEEVKRVRFLSRLNRFTLAVEDEGLTLKAYLPNSGSLEELLLPGKDLMVVPNPKGKLPLRAVGTLDLEGKPIMIDSIKSNELLPLIIESIPSLKGYTIVRREVSYGSSRFDFLLEEKESGRHLLLEVKSCTLFYEGVASFPDAPTERGRRHIETLSALGTEALGGVLFLIQRPVKYLVPNFHKDPDFARALYSAKDRILIEAISLEWDESLNLKEGSVKEVKIPWDEAKILLEDKGAYLISLFNDEDRSLSLPSGKIFLLPKGFYIYVGSGLRKLSSRIKRHLRKGGKAFWHIDHIKKYMNIIGSFSIRSPLRMECRIARELQDIADDVIPGFGCSDCDCQSHLLYFKKDPKLNEGLFKLLLKFQFGTIRDFIEGHSL